MSENSGPILFTIGHSNHAIEEFIRLLRTHGITAVADVRSQPYSRYNPQYNTEALSIALQHAGIAYVFLGKELGARPEERSCFENGHVSFRRLAGSEEFAQGIERLLTGAKRYRIAVMCAEKDPLECHRTILVARRLRTMGVHIKHILSDGGIEDHHDAEKRLVKLVGIEPNLFGPPETTENLIERAYDQQAENIAHHAEPAKGTP